MEDFGSKFVELHGMVFGWAILAAGVVGLLYAWYLRTSVGHEDPGTEKMQEVAGLIQQGAFAYLNRQFRTIAVLVVVLFIALFFSAKGEGLAIQVARPVAFLLGCLASGVTGYMGMTLAVRGNVRTTAAARTSSKEALNIAFKSGGVAGMFTVGMGLIGATAIFLIFKEKATEVLLGFGFGGCLLALFMRVGGGIYTKAADVGADLVGKVEAGIPEDDPRNAAVIADNVGDNVGDCAGMAADLFESYEVTLVASMILALAHAAGDAETAVKWIIFPLSVRAIGVLTSIVGIYMVRAKDDEEHAMQPITRGFVVSAVLSAIGFALVAKLYCDDWRLFWATLFGLALSVVIYKLTEYYTSTRYPPVKEIAKSTQTGTATNILTGFATGLESSVVAVLVICGAVMVSWLIFATGGESGVEKVLATLYGISLCGMGMLTTTGVIVSMDTYGPVADNAQGIAEMAGVDEAGPVLQKLDAVGNVTKAATKGFAIASAVLAALSLFGTYLSKVAGGGGEAVNAEALTKLHIDVADPKVFIGLLIGGALPFLFSSMTIRAVGRTAFQIINEVRRQFREIPGLMEGKAQPDPARCVDICTRAAIGELVAPGLLAILAPLVVGSFLGWPGLGGYLAGIIVSGQLLAVFMANSGGAWDNAKKYIEDGNLGGKGSDAHKAAVVGDTVGDPFKDTAGPALNPLIKVMNLVGLLITPLVVKLQGDPMAAIIGVIGAGVIVLAFVIARGRGGFSEGAVEKAVAGAEE
ncbi:MAG: sodium-translocating pyrophosphatase [Armatimonadetes bacterium]|nr:sodium-translocating pyrophosphatase [Armatimonadota bacterium]